MRARTALPLLLALAAAPAARADGPADNDPKTVRRVPKPGIELADDDRKELQEGLDRLHAAIDGLDAKNAQIAALRPDVEIFHKAVQDALQHQEFFAKEDVARAKNLLKEGQARAEQLDRGESPWATQAGLVVRGYVSKIDGSVQPYGLVIPENDTARGDARHRLDIWFHGRGETLSEVNFLDQRMHSRGDIAPADAIVLHPYGRYCNAFKFAGEVDVFEALEDVQRRYRIDEDRVAVRGFSMGGAACWQFAVHDADRWFAANPGAGFAETPRFLDVFQKEKLAPTWYEQKLWHLYNCNDVAGNLLQCPTVAYSGELDVQKQAADVMAEALRDRGVALTHVIGPATKHAIHPGSKREIEARLASIAARGRVRLPETVMLETYTLRYNRMNWVTIDALTQHWEHASVFARISGPSRVEVAPRGVEAITLDMPPGWCPFEPARPVTVQVDDDELQAPGPASDRSWHLQLARRGDHWVPAAPEGDGLRKRHGLQGPIDDAFMESFVFVRPTGKCRNEKVQAWVDSELARAIERWRRQFRGNARVVDDSAVTGEMIQGSNLVLWGDPESNAVMKRIADRLPIAWTADAIRAGNASFPAADHALILAYPNPLNPGRYVVLNSGFTYREYDDLNNARQVPKLPDWAVVDLRTPPDARAPGKVVAADFFGERWELRAPKADDR